jgi:hypothetical protein
VVRVAESTYFAIIGTFQEKDKCKLAIQGYSLEQAIEVARFADRSLSDHRGKSNAAPALLSYLAHVLSNYRHGLVVNVQATRAAGKARVPPQP